MFQGKLLGKGISDSDLRVPRQREPDAPGPVGPLHTAAQCVHSSKHPLGLYIPSPPRPLTNP